jgi:hypothetical protein
LKHIKQTLQKLIDSPVDPDKEQSVLELLLTKDGVSQNDVLLLILDLLLAGIDTVSFSWGFLENLLCQSLMMD